MFKLYFWHIEDLFCYSNRASQTKLNYVFMSNSQLNMKIRKIEKKMSCVRYFKPTSVPDYFIFFFTGGDKMIRSDIKIYDIIWTCMIKIFKKMKICNDALKWQIIATTIFSRASEYVLWCVKRILTFQCILLKNVKLGNLKNVSSVFFNWLFGESTVWYSHDLIFMMCHWILNVPEGRKSFMSCFDKRNSWNNCDFF